MREFGGIEVDIGEDDFLRSAAVWCVTAGIVTREQQTRSSE